jgi:integrase
LQALADHVLVDAREAEEFLIYPRWERTLERRHSRPPAGEEVSADVSSWVHEWWSRCLKRAEVKHFPMHELRHTAGTEFHRAVHDLELTRQFMRHASITTTSSVYLHLDDEEPE